MTDEVLEITLRGPRPFFLQLLAHPELAIIQQGDGTGPYRLRRRRAGGVRLQRPRAEDEDPDGGAPEILLRGERAALAIARFADGQRVLVVGGTIGDLPLARAADLPAAAFVFDPVSGLFGLSFAAREGPLADPAVRRALAMAVDRAGARHGDRRARPRRRAPAWSSPGVQELPNAALPDWAALPQEQRRAEAARGDRRARAGGAAAAARRHAGRARATGWSSPICATIGG